MQGGTPAAQRHRVPPSAVGKHRKAPTLPGQAVGGNDGMDWLSRSGGSAVSVGRLRPGSAAGRGAAGAQHGVPAKAGLRSATGRAEKISTRQLPPEEVQAARDAQEWLEHKFRKSGAPAPAPGELSVVIEFCYNSGDGRQLTTDHAEDRYHQEAELVRAFLSEYHPGAAVGMAGVAAASPGSGHSSIAFACHSTPSSSEAERSASVSDESAHTTSLPAPARRLLHLCVAHRLPEAEHAEPTAAGRIRGGRADQCRRRACRHQPLVEASLQAVARVARLAGSSRQIMGSDARAGGPSAPS